MDGDMQDGFTSRNHRLPRPSLNSPLNSSARPDLISTPSVRPDLMSTPSTRPGLTPTPTARPGLTSTPSARPELASTPSTRPDLTPSTSRHAANSGQGCRRLQPPKPNFSFNSPQLREQLAMAVHNCVTPLRSNAPLISVDSPLHPAVAALSNITPSKVGANPFERETMPGLEHHPFSPAMLSPAMFREQPAVDPEVFQWSTRERAMLNPVQINECPVQQDTCNVQFSPAIEQIVQSMVRSYFERCRFAATPSPSSVIKRDLNSPGIKTPAPCEEPPATSSSSTVACQTDVSVPVDYDLISLLVEEAVRTPSLQYHFQKFFASQNSQASSATNKLSSPGLRRKLAYDDGASSSSPTEDAYSSPSRSISSQPSSTLQFSSSPIDKSLRSLSPRLRRCSTAPADIESPAMSPIQFGGGNYSLGGGSPCAELVDSPGLSPITLSGDDQRSSQDMYERSVEERVTEPVPLPALTQDCGYSTMYNSGNSSRHTNITTQMAGLQANGSSDSGHQSSEQPVEQQVDQPGVAPLEQAVGASQSICDTTAPYSQPLEIDVSQQLQQLSTSTDERLPAEPPEAATLEPRSPVAMEISPGPLIRRRHSRMNKTAPGLHLNMRPAIHRSISASALSSTMSPDTPDLPQGLKVLAAHNVPEVPEYVMSRSMYEAEEPDESMDLLKRSFGKNAIIFKASTTSKNDSQVLSEAKLMKYLQENK